MHHFLLTGTFVELQAQFLEQVAALRQQNPLAPLTVLIPGQLVRASLSRELTRSGCPHANIRFQTLHETALHLAEPLLRERGLHPLRDVTRDLLMQKVMNDVKPRLKYFTRIADFKGFQTKLLATLADLSGACVTIDALREAAKSDFGPSYPKIALKLNELALLWEQYGKLLQQHRLVERATILEFAIDALPAANDSHPLLVYGLDELTELELRFLFAFCRERETTIYHPWRNAPGYAFTTELLKRYLDEGFEDITQPKEYLESDRLLSLVQNGVFQEPTPRDCAIDYTDNSLTILSNPDAHRETIEAVREIVYPASAPTDTERTAILLRTATPYTNYLRGALRQAGTQAYFHECRTLGESLCGSAIRKLTRLLNGEFKRVDVADFLLCGRIKPPASLRETMTELPAAEWNHFSLLAGVTGGADNWLTSLSRYTNGIQRKAERALLQDEEDTTDYARQLASLNAFTVWLKTLFETVWQIRACKSFADFTDALRAACDDFTATDESTDEIFDQLEQAVQLDASDIQLDLAAMLTCVESALRTPAKREGRYQESEPTVATLMQTRGVVFDHVFLIGLNEGEFPRFTSQDPILLDFERELLSHALSQGTFAITVPRLANRVAQEKYYFAAALDSARRRITLSFSRMGSRNRETLPSRFVLAALSAITGAVADVRELYAFIDKHQYSRRVARDELSINALHRREYNAREIAQALDSGSPERLAYLQNSIAFQRLLTAERARFHTRTFTEYEGDLTSIAQSDTEAYLRQLTSLLSASQLETYWTCPFRWFASRVLGLEQLEEPDILSEHDPLVRGSLIHEILEEFYRSEKKAGRIASLTADDWPRLRQFANEKFREFAETQPTGLYAIWTREQSKILELLQRFFADDVTQRADFLPERFEWRFGQEERQVKFPISKQQEIFLRGAIDRIDTHPDGRRKILDYKSGSNYNKLNSDNLLQRRALQLHLYKYAVESLLHVPVTRAAYYYMRERGNPKIELTDEAATATQQELTAILETLTEGMRGGACWAYPDENVCRNCPVKSACGQSRLTRKWSNENQQTAAYRKIRGGEA